LKFADDTKVGGKVGKDNELMELKEDLCTVAMVPDLADIFIIFVYYIICSQADKPQQAKTNTN